MSNENEGDPPSYPQSHPILPTLPVAPQQSISGATQADKPNRDSPATKKELHWLEKLNIFGQLSLVGIGIVAACIYGCQLHTMNGQLGQMKGSGEQTEHLLSLYQQQLTQLTRQATDTHDLATQAGNQADGTRDIAQTSRNALISVQRAFVYPSIMYGKTDDPNGKNPLSEEITIKWENSGTTPTRDMTSHYSWVPGNAPPTSWKDKWEPGVPHKNIKTFIGPRGAVYTKSISTPFNLLEAYWRTHTHIYVWGWSKYRDVFQGTRKHITRFCYDFSFDPSYNTSGQIIGWITTPNECSTGNCSDEECKVQ